MWVPYNINVQVFFVCLYLMFHVFPMFDSRTCPEGSRETTVLLVAIFRPVYDESNPVISNSVQCFSSISEVLWRIMKQERSGFWKIILKRMWMGYFAAPTWEYFYHGLHSGVATTLGRFPRIWSMCRQTYNGEAPHLGRQANWHHECTICRWFCLVGMMRTDWLEGVIMTYHDHCGDLMP